jgi:hypothetical protein
MSSPASPDAQPSAGHGWVRVVAVIVAVAASGGCFGCLAYLVWIDIDNECMRFMERGLYAECFAPAGSVIAYLVLIFAVATTVLAYLALRRR